MTIRPVMTIHNFAHDLPVAVIGAGPVDLAAAAHLALRDQAFVVFESGPVAGAAVAEWGHVTFFSPWRYVVDDAARQLLEATGWSMPDPDRVAAAVSAVAFVLAARLRPTPIDNVKTSYV